MTSRTNLEKIMQPEDFPLFRRIEEGFADWVKLNNSAGQRPGAYGYNNAAILFACLWGQEADRFIDQGYEPYTALRKGLKAIPSSEGSSISMWQAGEARNGLWEFWIHSPGVPDIEWRLILYPENCELYKMNKNETPHD
jgi:hypothetical protein